jgi:hypothetical protein
MTLNLGGNSGRRAAAVVVSAFLALGAFAPTASADWRDHHDHHDWHRHGWGWTGGYYPPPPVVYGNPYPPPPVVYGPGIGINIGIR